MRSVRRFQILAACLIAVAMTAAVAIVSTVQAAQFDYPTRAVKIFVGAAPGGLIDQFARIFASKLQERGGHPVVVENNSIATGTVAANEVANAAPDGYTLLMGHPASMVMWPILDPKLPYNPAKDFVPIALVGEAANILLVPAKSPIKSVPELIALAKAKPGTVTYASQGIGSSAHMATEQFSLEAGIKLIHVPYRGSMPAITDLIAGRVMMMIDTVPFNLGYIKAGTLRALAVASPKRHPLLPDVPTMAEVGLPNVQGGLWLALFAPAHTPPQIVSYLNQQAREIFNLPDVRQRLESQGLTIPVGSSEELASFLAAERTRWTEVIQRAHIKLEQ